MRFLPTLTTLLLGLTSARAYLEDDLPPGYKITKVIEVPVDSQWPEVQDNEDKIPLYNAQLRCTITPYGFYLCGRHWDGVSEHWIKKVITHTKGEENKRTISTGTHDWNFERKKEEGMWEAQFELYNPQLADKMIIELHILTGLWGKNDKRTSFEISNGTHTQTTSMEKLYPGDPNGRIFPPCQRAQGMGKDEAEE